MKNFLLLMFISLIFCSLSAQEVGVASKESLEVPKSEAKEKKKDGWYPSLALSAGFSLADNKNVVGQLDGTSMAFSLNVEGKIDLFKNDHEWRSALMLKEQFQNTPEFDRFIKSADLVHLKSIYLYHVSKWWGPFAQAQFHSVLFSGKVNSVDNETYILPDGTAKVTNSLKVNYPFAPITLKEMVGAFSQPYKKEYLMLEVRAGAGAHQVFARDAYNIGEQNENNGTYPVIQLEDYNQLGAALALKATGKFMLETKITYSVLFETLMPFVYDDKLDRNPIELTNYDIQANLSAEIATWLAVTYSLRALKQPQLIDEWQVQNNLLISIKYLFVGE